MDQGDDVARWLSDFLGNATLRLVYFDEVSATYVHCAWWSRRCRPCEELGWGRVNNSRSSGGYRPAVMRGWLGVRVSSRWRLHVAALRVLRVEHVPRCLYLVPGLPGRAGLRSEDRQEAVRGGLAQRHRVCRLRSLPGDHRGVSSGPQRSTRVSREWPWCRHVYRWRQSCVESSDRVPQCRRRVILWPPCDTAVVAELAYPSSILSIASLVLRSIVPRRCEARDRLSGCCCGCYGGLLESADPRQPFPSQHRRSRRCTVRRRQVVTHYGRRNTLVVVLIVVLLPRCLTCLAAGSDSRSVLCTCTVFDAARGARFRRRIRYAVGCNRGRTACPWVIARPPSRCRRSVTFPCVVFLMKW